MMKKLLMVITGILAAQSAMGRSATEPNIEYVCKALSEPILALNVDTIFQKNLIKILENEEYKEELTGLQQDIDRRSEKYPKDFLRQHHNDLAEELVGKDENYLLNNLNLVAEYCAWYRLGMEAMKPDIDVRDSKAAPKENTIPNIMEKTFLDSAIMALTNPLTMQGKHNELILMKAADAIEGLVQAQNKVAEYIVEHDGPMNVTWMNKPYKIVQNVRNHENDLQWLSENMDKVAEYIAWKDAAKEAGITLLNKKGK